MVSPNLNGYKASFDFYFCPWSNFYGDMDNNNKTDTQAWIDMDRWTYSHGVTFSATSSSHPLLSTLHAGSVKAGSLLDYLGLPVGYFGRVTDANGSVMPTAHPAEKLLSVLDIYRNYYVNDQEGVCYVLNEWVDSSSTDRLMSIDLQQLDAIFTALRSVTQGASHGDLVEYLAGIDGVDASIISDILRCSIISPLGGLPLRTYRMDLNRGLMNQSVGTLTSKVNVNSGSVDVTTIRFANKMQTLIDRLDVSGGRFSDMMRMRWGVTPRGYMNKPDYLGSVSSFFGVSDLIATASGMNNSEGLDDRGNSVLGQQGGYAVRNIDRNNVVSFRADQYGTFVCMFSLVPLVTYSQGIEIEDTKTTFADIFDPAFNQLGYQDVSASELSVFPTTNISATQVTSSTALTFLDNAVVGNESVGKRFAYSEYMAGLPRAHGLFAFGEDFDQWVNNRIYTRYKTDFTYVPSSEYDECYATFSRLGATDFSTYIMPDVINNLFVDQSRSAQNFRLRAVFDCSVRRNVGSRVMPHM